jgi:hypothetical protein
MNIAVLIRHLENYQEMLKSKGHNTKRHVLNEYNLYLQRIIGQFKVIKSPNKANQVLDIELTILEKIFLRKFLAY